MIAKYIKHKKNLTVITNSIPVVNELMNSAVELIIIGGKVRLNEQSVIAYDYLFNFSELNILKAFICASGITLEKGISDYNLEEAQTRKKSLSAPKRYMSPPTILNSGKTLRLVFSHSIKLVTS